MSPKIYFPLPARRTLPLEESRTNLSLSEPWPLSTPRGRLNTAGFCPGLVFNPQPSADCCSILFTPAEFSPQALRKTLACGETFTMLLLKLKGYLFFAVSWSGGVVALMYGPSGRGPTQLLGKLWLYWRNGYYVKG